MAKKPVFSKNGKRMGRPPLKSVTPVVKEPQSLVDTGVDNEADWVDKPEQIAYANGSVLSSKIPPLHLIPTIALESLAHRFQKGIERKGDKSWNALSQNQEVLLDREFAIERIAHIIHHASKLRDKLFNGDEIPGNDDDAGAILWGGAFLACVADALNKQKGS